MSALTRQAALFEYVLRLGDDALINGQRLSEWCGHGPFLEEDIGLANTALDLIGRARMLLSYAADLEGRGRTEDDLAYLRDERQWFNVLIMELPRGDFAFSTARQFLVDSYNYFLYEALQASTDARLAAIAGKAFKEAKYHLRHTSEWMLRLGDGTQESHAKIQQALEEAWPYTGELFEVDEVEQQILQAGIGPDAAELARQWQKKVGAVLAEAGLQRPKEVWPQTGGRQGLHTEHMGYLLAEMQCVQRAYPGQQW